jgi:hypothetical protein
VVRDQKLNIEGGFGVLFLVMLEMTGINFALSDVSEPLGRSDSKVFKSLSSICNIQMPH